jgi:hypothetical protein
MNKIQAGLNEALRLEKLRQAVLAYLSEYDNPVPDYIYRRTLREHLRSLVGNKLTD